MHVLSIQRCQHVLGRSFWVSVVWSKHVRRWVQRLERREVAVANLGARYAEVPQATAHGTGQRSERSDRAAEADADLCEFGEAGQVG